MLAWAWRGDVTNMAVTSRENPREAAERRARRAAEERAAADPLWQVAHSPAAAAAAEEARLRRERWGEGAKRTAGDA